MAKMSKLCYGALSALDQLESKQKSDDNDKSVNQPMERIKRLSEESVRLNTLVQQIDQNLHDLLVQSVTKNELKSDVIHLGTLKFLLSF